MLKWTSKFSRHDKVWSRRVKLALAVSGNSDFYRIWKRHILHSDYELNSEAFSPFYSVIKKQELQRDGAKRFSLRNLTDLEKEAVKYTEEWKDKYVTKDSVLMAMEVADRLRRKTSGFGNWGNWEGWESFTIPVTKNTFLDPFLNPILGELFDSNEE